MTFREEIRKETTNKNPNLNQWSVDAYVSKLLDLKNNLHPDGEDIKWFNECKINFKHLKDKERLDRIRILAAFQWTFNPSICSTTG